METAAQTGKLQKKIWIVLCVIALALCGVWAFFYIDSNACALFKRYAEERNYDAAAALFEGRAWSAASVKRIENEYAPMLIDNAINDYENGGLDIRRLLGIIESTEKMGKHAKSAAANFLSKKLEDITANENRGNFYRDNFAYGYLDVNDTKAVAESLNRLKGGNIPWITAFPRELTAYGGVADQLTQAQAALKDGKFAEAYQLLYAVLNSDEDINALRNTAVYTFRFFEPLFLEKIDAMVSDESAENYESAINYIGEFLEKCRETQRRLSNYSDKQYKSVKNLNNVRLYFTIAPQTTLQKQIDAKLREVETAYGGFAYESGDYERAIELGGIEIQKKARTAYLPAVALEADRLLAGNKGPQAIHYLLGKRKIYPYYCPERAVLDKLLESAMDASHAVSILTLDYTTKNYKSTDGYILTQKANRCSDTYLNSGTEEGRYNFGKFAEDEYRNVLLVDGFYGGFFEFELNKAYSSVTFGYFSNTENIKAVYVDGRKLSESDFAADEISGGCKVSLKGASRVRFASTDPLSGRPYSGVTRYYNVLLYKNN